MSINDSFSYIQSKTRSTFIFISQITAYDRDLLVENLVRISELNSTLPKSSTIQPYQKAVLFKNTPPHKDGLVNRQK